MLPAHSACRAIVTSRHTLGRLGARLFDLDTLDTDAAVELLCRAIRVARPSDTQITDHPADARPIAEACGGLPLALRILAAMLADNPRKALAAMAADLADREDRLAEFSCDTEALTAAFDLSYAQLPDSRARLFRLLSANPGPDISTPATAALADLPEVEARRGDALTNLGNDLQGVRRFEEAIGAHQRAAQIFRDTGDRRSETIALRSLQETTQDQDAAQPGASPN